MEAAPAPALRLGYEVELAYRVNTGGADFIFSIQAARTRHQAVVSESLGVSQFVPLQEDSDARTGRLLRLRAMAGMITLDYRATVELHHHREASAAVAETWIPDLPGHVLPFLYPSRYCESDQLNGFAMQQFGGLWQGHGRVQAICDWVQRNIAFVPGSSSGTTGAVDTLRDGRGVCRDSAHLMIALCRAVNIPARFSTGLDYGADPALGPTDFHAYVEAFVGGRWYLFDPSGTAVPMGFVRIASGRDAADCAYASIFGDVTPLTRRLAIFALPGADGVVREPFRTPAALSTATE